MPVVQISIKQGQSRETKQQLVAGVTDTLVDVCGSARERIHVIINEVGEDNWGRGGSLLSDLK